MIFVAIIHALTPDLSGRVKHIDLALLAGGINPLIERLTKMLLYQSEFDKGVDARVNRLAGCFPDLIDASVLAFTVPGHHTRRWSIRPEQGHHPLVKCQAGTRALPGELERKCRLARTNGSFDKVNFRQGNSPANFIAF